MHEDAATRAGMPVTLPSERATAPTDTARSSAVLKELDSYREAMRAAFDEGFALSKLGGPIELAWQGSEARQTECAFAYTRISVGSFFRVAPESPISVDAVARTLDDGNGIQRA